MWFYPQRNYIIVLMENQEKIYLVCDDCDCKRTDLIVYRVHNQMPRILCQNCYAKRVINWSKYDVISNSNLDKLEYAHKTTVNGKLRYCLTKRYRKTQNGSVYYHNTYYENNEVVASEIFVSEAPSKQNRWKWLQGKIDKEYIENKTFKRSKRKAPYKKRYQDNYLVKNYKTFCIALNREKDKELIEFLIKQPNHTEKIREMFEAYKKSSFLD